MFVPKKLVFAIALAVGFNVSLSAQFNTRSDRSSAEVGINNVNAPVPDPLLKGRKAFISYELGDVTAFPSSYSGGPERAYEEFYSQMKAWGRYELVADPKDADVMFAVRFVDPPAIPHPQIRIGVMDPRCAGFAVGICGGGGLCVLQEASGCGVYGVGEELVKDVQVWFGWRACGGGNSRWELGE